MCCGFSMGKEQGKGKITQIHAWKVWVKQKTPWTCASLSWGKWKYGPNMLMIEEATALWYTCLLADPWVL